MSSITDVAKLAGVAKSTVSLVMNNSGYVSEETRGRVEKAIAELEYRPSQLARNLSLNRSELVGIVIPDVSHPFYGSFVRYAEEALFERNYKCLVCSSAHRDEMELKFLDMLRNQTIDGIIMGSHSFLHEKYEHLHKPLVAFDRELGEQTPLVRSDHQRGGALAARRFAECGCREVVQISTGLNVNSPARLYHTEFAAGLEKQGIRRWGLEMGRNSFMELNYEQAAREVFDMWPEADGIFGSDLAVLACMREAVRRGRKIAQDIHLLAYDGTYITRMGERVVDAVVQPIERMARVCVELIDRQIRGLPITDLRPVLPVTEQPGQTMLPVHQTW